LLRGVNVGGNRKVSMATLRSMIESLGHTDVTTYIQSGNVVFSSTGTVTPGDIERVIDHKLGLDVDVMLRTRADLKRIVKGNPFSAVDLSTVHVAFLSDKPKPATVSALDGTRFEPDTFAVKGREVYLHLPNGMGRSKLPAHLDRQLKIPATVRNWNTVQKLLELSGG
jgi:uncharacterized protein (DUF1697 family)